MIVLYNFFLLKKNYMAAVTHHVANAVPAVHKVTAALLLMVL